MKDDTLLKISLCCALTGILIILFIVENSEIPESNIANLTKANLDQTVSVSGQITRIVETPGLLIINLKDSTGEITAIIFKENNLTLRKNQIVTIEGTLIEYEGKLEIQSDLLKMKKWA
ncbi:exodeoxyribonuclease VII large subunit [Candidatus Woesearchaeota archaeon]|jgi:RecJ-like exonuclease|nr:exodeoxyribonuclease VII large subunit [Candidatus Woesearchaeota archaeon]